MPDQPDPAYRIFVSYIDKSREYYLAQDYGNPYRWAHYDDVPFTPLAKPLAASRVALVTTSSLIPGGHDVDPDPEAMPPPSVYAAPSEPPPARLYTQHRSWDKDATHTNDLDSFFPIHRLQEYRAEGRIGSISPRFYGAPTDYSQRRTIEQDGPQVLEWCREDGVDVAILVPL
jgi:Glycine/sarcosine/betaine reductase selenoprotein B (GRDB)